MGTFGKKKINGKYFVPSVARYNRKDADALVKRLTKFPKLSVQPKKATYRVQREVYRGKKTDRWLVYQDYKSYKIRKGLSGFKV